MFKLFGVKSNWQFILYFMRSELMADANINSAIKFLKLFGHKKHPKNPTETIQRTIQNLRDKGYIDFLGQGEYRLTVSGKDEILNLKSKIEVFEEYTTS